MLVLSKYACVDKSDRALSLVSVVWLLSAATLFINPGGEGSDKPRERRVVAVRHCTKSGITEQS
jgi:hypothetical protein